MSREPCQLKGEGHRCYLRGGYRWREFKSREKEPIRRCEQLKLGRYCAKSGCEQVKLEKLGPSLRIIHKNSSYYFVGPCDGPNRAV